MPLEAVTFDFHNTLARCDEWFQIEIRELVPRLLDWLSTHDGSRATDGEREEAVTHYRELRMEIMETGEERDAYDCAQHVVRALGREVDPDAIRRGVDAVMLAALGGSTPIDGSVEAVRHLHAHDIRLAVVSSAVHHPFLEWSLRKFGILDCFEHVITSASCGFYKSRTEIYAHALECLGVAPSSAVHVGDSYRFDVETATRAGMRTVWLAPPGTSDDDVAGLTVTTLDGVGPLVLDTFGMDR